MSEEVQEGFLCPICVVDLGDLVRLKLHFEEKHAKEDPIFLQNIKDLFGKAKKKIIQDDNVFLNLNPEATFPVSASVIVAAHDPVSGIHDSVESVGNDVVFNWITADFKGDRKKILDRNTASNQVLFRLERLLRDLPEDAAKRRAHETSVVPWLDEELVKLCPGCAKSFNVAVRRKHHCRLCGGVLCNDCSKDVDVEEAAHLVKALQVASSSSSMIASKKAKPIRACRLCADVVARKRLEAEAKSPPRATTLTMQYRDLEALMTEGRRRGREYRVIVDSLYNGEDKHDLREAEVLRVRLLKIADAIDGLSKRIAEDDSREEEVKLRTRIRAAAVNFIKDCLVGLPGVPTEEEFNGVRRARLEEVARRVNEEKMASKVARQRFVEEERRQRPSMMKKTSSGFALNSSTSSTLVSEDPMVQQIYNLREFIAQARRLNKTDEVKALEANLADLRAEYKKQRSELEDNYESFKDVFNSPRNDDEESMEAVDIDEYDKSGKNPFL